MYSLIIDSTENKIMLDKIQKLHKENGKKILQKNPIFYFLQKRKNDFQVKF